MGRVVVVVGSVEVEGDATVDVVDETVVAGGVDLWLVASSPAPVKTSASSATDKTIRKRQRAWGNGLGEFCMCWSP